MSTTSGRQAGSSCTRWGEGPLDQVGSRPQTNALSCKLTLRWPCPGAAVESAHNWWCRPSNSTTHDSTRPPGGGNATPTSETHPPAPPPVSAHCPELSSLPSYCSPGAEKRRPLSAVWPQPEMLACRRVAVNSCTALSPPSRPPHHQAAASTRPPAQWSRAKGRRAGASAGNRASAAVSPTVAP